MAIADSDSLNLVNFFAHKTAAERYARSRPYFHPLVIERIRAFLGLKRPLPVAVDVACGTGQSALALTEIAESVIATDLSPSMLAHAPAHERIRYVQAVSFAQRILVRATLREWENRLLIDYLITDEASGRRLTKGSTSQVAVDMNSGEILFVSPPVLFERLGLAR